MNTINLPNKTKASETKIFAVTHVPKVKTSSTSLKAYDSQVTNECTFAANDSDTTIAPSVQITDQKPDQNRSRLGKVIGYLSASNLAHYDRMLIAQNQRKRDHKRLSKVQQRQKRVSGR